MLLAVTLGVGLTGCGPSDNSDGTDDPGSKQGQVVLSGAGATFPSPVYASWTYNYTESTKNQVLVNYQGTGSGAGINQLKAGTVDFAGTDAPLTQSELDEAGLIQFPMLSGGVVVVVNLPGIENGKLKLSQKTLADIFMGKIQKWNDPVVVKENPKTTLPESDITVVHRSDSSGTSFLFTHYLAQISPEWKEKVGEGKTVNWPVGIGGQKNPGVCNNVAKISGAIGYTEYTYAVETKLAMASLENAAGQYVTPSIESFTEALKSASWKAEEGFYQVVTNASGEKSYPLVGITYILLNKDLESTKKDNLVNYIDWCFDAGKNIAVKMNYVPIPDTAIAVIRPVLEK
ncbi:MAG: phosphate ABC transporter substrate-binding protein PstS [Planctomycetia bacterium]|nr:phosphate ABC transporter substrate-binding protein PstS [Planctomycetia bacterium]